MEIVVKKLSKELTEDYIHFHRNVAFIDNPEWAGCYCTWYHWDSKLDLERKEYECNGGKDFKMEVAKRFIEEGKLRGYLAYVNGDVVGWCNANDRSSFEKLNFNASPKLWLNYNEEAVKSIICFTIAPNMRRKGLTGLMLKEVIRHSVSEGYDYIEAYPGTGTPDNRSYHGSLSIYHENGFVSLETDEGVYRKYLKR